MNDNKNVANGNNNSRNRGKGKGKGKGRKPNTKYETRYNSSKSQRQAKEVEDTAYEMSKSNPVQWYQRFPQFMKDASTLPFGQPLGQVVNYSNEVTNVNVTDAKIAIPGLKAITFAPSIGWSADNTSPINRSATRFFTYLRNIQKAAAKYDSQDVMMYCMALDSCYMFYHLMRRAYGISKLWSPVNKYYPQAVLQASGFSSTLLDNLAEFRAYINKFALNLGQFTVPKDFGITLRHEWMCEGLYYDSNNTKAQTYMFVPQGMWRYDNTVSTGSQLEWVDWLGTASSPTLHTLADIQTFGASLIANLVGDEDTGWISGDIYAAYGPNGSKQLEETPENYGVLPMYDQTVLSQIENSTAVGGWASNYTPVISQNPSVNNGAILFTPKFSSYYTPAPTGYSNLQYQITNVLNMHMDSPSPDDVMEATRLMCGAPTSDSVKASSATTGALELHALPADIVFQYRTVHVNPETGKFRASALNTNVVTKSSADIVEVTLQNGQFDWAPILRCFNPGTATSTWNFAGFFGDIDNITIMPDWQLLNMHEAAMLSLFDIPQMGWKA